MIFVAPPGAFPREADRGLCNFLHVTLTKNPIFSDFERLDGGRTLDPRCLYSGSGLFRGYIERFSNFYSRRGRNFALAREFLWGTHTGISDPTKIPIRGVGILAKIWKIMDFKSDLFCMKITLHNVWIGITHCAGLFGMIIFWNFSFIRSKLEIFWRI